MSIRLKQVNLSAIALADEIMNDEETPSPLFIYRNVWNNQIDEAIYGNTYSFASPAIFIEVQTGKGGSTGGGVMAYPEFMIAFHIYHMSLDGEFGTMEQNVSVFDIAEKIKDKFNFSRKVSWCNALQLQEDTPDYKHGNVYKYIIAYKCHFTDVAGSDFDFAHSGVTYGYLTNPEDALDLNIFFAWDSEMSYVALKDAVSYRGKAYLCKTSNNDTEFNENNWYLIYPFIGGVEYVIDTYICHDNHIYKCTTANSDTIFTLANWQLIL